LRELADSHCAAFETTATPERPGVTPRRGQPRNMLSGNMFGGHGVAVRFPATRPGAKAGDVVMIPTGANA
jgi:hypothetical protein